MLPEGSRSSYQECQQSLSHHSLSRLPSLWISAVSSSSSPSSYSCNSFSTSKSALRRGKGAAGRAESRDDTTEICGRWRKWRPCFVEGPCRFREREDEVQQYVCVYSNICWGQLGTKKITFDTPRRKTNRRWRATTRENEKSKYSYIHYFICEKKIRYTILILRGCFFIGHSRYSRSLKKRFNYTSRSQYNYFLKKNIYTSS